MSMAARHGGLDGRGVVMMQLRRWRPGRSSVSGVTVSLAASWDTAMRACGRACEERLLPSLPVRPPPRQPPWLDGVVRCNAYADADADADAMCSRPPSTRSLCFWRQLRFCKSALWFIYEQLGVARRARH